VVWKNPVPSSLLALSDILASRAYSSATNKFSRRWAEENGFLCLQQRGERISCRVVGHATMRQSPALRGRIEQALVSGPITLHVDLHALIASSPVRPRSTTRRALSRFLRR
jgi:hypothetical protein